MRKLYKEKQIRTYISYFFIVVIAAIIATIIYYEFRIIPIDEFGKNTNTTALNLLSTEEVDAEREKFLPMLEKPNIVAEPSTLGTATFYATDADAKQAELSLSNNSLNNYADENLHKDLTLISETTQSDGSVMKSYSSSGATLTAVNDYEPLDMKPLVIEGSIIKIDSDKKVISVALRNNTGLATIQFNSDTKILINNKPMDFSSLRIADTIRSEGFGDETTNSLIKTNITIITGFHQLIPTI